MFVPVGNLFTREFCIFKFHFSRHREITLDVAAPGNPPLDYSGLHRVDCDTILTSPD